MIRYFVLPLNQATDNHVKAELHRLLGLDYVPIVQTINVCCRKIEDVILIEHQIGEEFLQAMFNSPHAEKIVVYSQPFGEKVQWFKSFADRVQYAARIKEFSE